MGRAKRQKLLTFAENQVAFYETAIKRQKDVIAELQKAGHKTTDAHRLLEGWQQMYSLFREERDRLRKEVRIPQQR
jgi:hypothetical protein